MAAGDLRLIEILLDEKTVVRRTPAIEQEREVAIYDLLEENFFAPEGSSEGSKDGPYRLVLSVRENRLLFDIRLADGRPYAKVLLSLAPFKRIIHDYFLICESYYKAIRTAPPSQIETLDMGRRSLHDEGSRILQARLKAKIAVDFDTARRLFTLICVLHLRG